MEANFLNWEEAYESAGLWPIAVELPLNDVVYLLWYQRRKDAARVLMAGDDVVVLGDLAGFPSLLDNCAGRGLGDPGWDAVRRLAAITGARTFDEPMSCRMNLPAGPSGEPGQAAQIPDEHSIPRRLVEQILDWLQHPPIHPTCDQAEEMLNCLDLFSEWHGTLSDRNLIGRWPSRFDGATSILASAVMWGDLTPAAAFQRINFLGIWPLAERMVSDLMQHTRTFSYELPAA
ncbi:MAG: hypothetical protein ACT4OM_00635 [Actinomycetota bacterium]